jgi:hypothetical protein
MFEVIVIASIAGLLFAIYNSSQSERTDVSEGDIAPAPAKTEAVMPEKQPAAPVEAAPEPVVAEVRKAASTAPAKAVKETTPKAKASAPPEAAPEPEVATPQKSAPAAAAVTTEVPKAKPAAAVETASEPAAAKVQETAPAAPAAAVEKVAASEPPPAQAPVAEPAEAPKAPPVVLNLRNPKTGEIAPFPNTYRFAKKWVKEMMVAEKLLPRVYNTSELENPKVSSKVKEAIERLKTLEKYHA